MFVLETRWPQDRHAGKAVAMSALALLLASCEASVPEPAPANVLQEKPIVPTPARSAASPPRLSRADLIASANEAASAYAAGKQPAAPDPLVGRTYSIAIAFGCSGPAPSLEEDAPGLARWSWGDQDKTILLSTTPADWTESAVTAGKSAAPDWEAVEGFWIPRPWMASEECPTALGDPLQTTNIAAAPETVGLAAIFETDSSRVGRRMGRAYAFTIRPDGDASLKPAAEGYRLILEGRIASYPDGRAIRCAAAGPDQRPVCVIATKLDRVAYESADGKMLSEWRPG